MTEQQAHDELRVYLIEQADPRFTLQHLVDAWAAQHATTETKPITLTFALVGLYLHLERKATGRYVQRVHMQLGRSKHEWPTFSLPSARGSMTVIDVMAVAPGPERNRAIDDWCASVWASYGDSHRVVEELLTTHGII
jgi:hypothetical protein